MNRLPLWSTGISGKLHKGLLRVIPTEGSESGGINTLTAIHHHSPALPTCPVHDMRMLLWSEKTLGQRDAGFCSKKPSGCKGTDRADYMTETKKVKL